MKQSVMKKWVKALRSGKYSQTTKGYLKDDIGYCCLGVLCDIMGKEFKEYPNANAFYVKSSQGRETESLPPSVQKECGMRSSSGDHGKFENLAELNDKGITFGELADIIEENWKKL